MTWSDVDWTATEAVVRRIQDRIFRAAKAGDGARVKNLQKLLVRSRSAKLLAIRQVTQRNAGRNTPGIDGVVCTTPEDRVTLLESGLELKGYKPKPVRRVYIPKAGKPGRFRPLGIPTVKDRVMQAVVKLALEPEWETRFEANSYGFRPGRCAMDAVEAIFIALGQKGSSRWILDADISGCFDEIAHEPLLARLPTFTGTIERWLKAGSIDMGTWSASEAGTPQGGIISPLAANVALDGMERLFGCEDRDGNPVKAVTKKGMDKSVVLIRYADDFLVTAPSKEILEQHVLPSIEAFLAERGLVLNREKTRIVSIDEGFNFLGFTARKFRNGKLLIIAGEGQGAGAPAPDQGVPEPEQAGSRRQGRAGSGPDHPGLDLVLPPRLLGPNLPVCRPPGLADAVGMGQAAAPDEKQKMGQGPLLQADPLAGVELRGCIAAGVGHPPLAQRHQDRPPHEGQGARQSPGPGRPALLGRAAAEETGGPIPLQATTGTPTHPRLRLRRMRRPVRPG